MASPRIIWAAQAKIALKDIYDYYEERSVQGARNVRLDLLSAPKTIRFSKQYQLDEITPAYRRIVVRDFKILYKETDSEIQILDIVSTRQSPEILRNK
ncbi:MAG: type II toxin-antitoxin system RelE/ParE family toxin [Flavobacteriales bacterium]|nr:type II toxin-antitoxin system RelE/ParE family toxin [Flavobacteriales bacterium]